MILRALTNDICNTLWHRLLRDYLHQFKELFVNSCFNQAVCGAKAAPTPPDVGDEYSTYRRTLWVMISTPEYTQAYVQSPKFMYLCFRVLKI